MTRLGVLTFFVVKTWICLTPRDWCQIVQGTWWSLQNLMKQTKFVAYEQNVIVYIFLLNFVISFASAADYQVSTPIVSKQTFYVKNLYTITFCSYATNFTHATSKFSSSQLYPRTIWHLFLGYRGISIIRGKIVAFSIWGICIESKVLELLKLAGQNFHLEPELLSFDNT